MKVIRKSVGHFREELDTHQPHFVLGVFVAEFLQGSLQVIGVALHEVVVDVVNLVFVHHLVEEIVDVELCAAINDGLHLVKQLLEILALGVCNVVERYLTVDVLDDFHLQH